jgi:NAD(P)-dependent dehydrogenase (short-subunit alcohol dehydrogenase family)
MPDIDRRRLLAGTAALTVASAASAPLLAEDVVAPDLSGKSFLITGSSSGFGNVGALHYARLGARVFATMRNMPRPEAKELREIAAEEKLDLHVLELDVMSDEQVISAVAEAERINGGPLDVLVNNAGIVFRGPVELQDMEAVHQQLSTNLLGQYRMVRAVLPGMRKRKSGLVFNVSSQQGRVIRPSMGFYSASKFAVEAMSEQLAYELVPLGIDLVIIQPGGYPTKVGDNMFRYTAELHDRVDPERAAGYPEMFAQMKPEGEMPSWPGKAPDPIDVPGAIAEITAMPPGRRPLRRAVSASFKPQLEINRVCEETQLSWLEKSPEGILVRAVYD